MIQIRPYKEADATALAAIYYNTIHTVNRQDYTEEQVSAWAPESSLEAEGWVKKWESLPPLVAVIDGISVGFAEFDADKGYIDCFYVHHEYQGKGVGSALMAAIFEKAKETGTTRIWSEVSITAKPFFEAKGFAVVKKQTVTLREVELTNFVMEKPLSSSLVFELAQEAQAELLIEFELTIAVPRLYSIPLDLPGAAKEISKNNYYFIKRDNTIVGTAAYAVREDGSGYISNIAVGPAYRGQGIARAAMQFLLEQCGESWRIDLVTHPENFRSVPLYESFGFVTEKRIENFYEDGEPRIIMAKNNALAKELRLVSCHTDIEWQAAKYYRQKYFFDKVQIDDPYRWTFDHNDHQHFVLYNNTDIIGYTHIQRWPENRAAMRIIVIEAKEHGNGFGKWLVKVIEKRLKGQDVYSLHAESSPDALPFYTALGYTPMPFDDPEAREGGKADIAMGKKL